MSRFQHNTAEKILHDVLLTNNRAFKKARHSIDQGLTLEGAFALAKNNRIPPWSEIWAESQDGKISRTAKAQILFGADDRLTSIWELVCIASEASEVRL